MKTANFATSSCRYCRYFQTEGRRGGVCQQLGVSVRAGWKACSLAAPPFTNAWENLEKVVRLENSLVLKCPVDLCAVEMPVETPTEAAPAVV